VAALSYHDETQFKKFVFFLQKSAQTYLRQQQFKQLSAYVIRTTTPEGEGKKGKGLEGESWKIRKKKSLEYVSDY